MNDERELVHRLVTADAATPPAPGVALTVDGLLARVARRRLRDGVAVTFGVLACACLVVAASSWRGGAEARALARRVEAVLASSDALLARIDAERESSRAGVPLGVALAQERAAFVGVKFAAVLAEFDPVAAARQRAAIGVLHPATKAGSAVLANAEVR
jgi:hypothetical protein